MTEATWGESAKIPEINWRMSASLENVPRGDNDVAEVTNLERAVRDWRELDPAASSCGRTDGRASSTDRWRIQHDLCR